MNNSYPGAEFDSIWQRLLRPTDYVNPQPQPNYHLVVVGAGPAGLIAAIVAAGLGAKVALIERHTMGGDCLNVGCVPSKCLLEYSKTHPGDFDGAFSWLREVRAGIAPHDSVDRYSKLGVDVFLGAAGMLDGQTVEVEGARLHARRFAICTGAAASVPPITGLREADPLTNETVFDLHSQPESIAILGAGVIGCELSQAFVRLGVSVHLFELADRVLPLQSERASAAVESALAAAGVNLYLGRGVSQVERASAGCVIHNGNVSISAERVLVALGRRPNTADLNLAVADVAVDAQGFIKVDNKLRSSNPHIFAAGDCASRLQFTHHADAQARALVQNALFAPSARVDGLVVPQCTYTSPEVASVGPGEAQLREQGIAFDTYEVAFGDLDRGKTENDTTGYAEVFTAAGSDKILGASIVGRDAGEQIGMVCLLMSNNLGLSAAGKTMLPYPTRSEFIKRLADAYNKTRFTPLAQKVARRWLKFTG